MFAATMFIRFFSSITRAHERTASKMIEKGTAEQYDT